MTAILPYGPRQRRDMRNLSVLHSAGALGSTEPESMKVLALFLMARRHGNRAMGEADFEGRRTGTEYDFPAGATPASATERRLPAGVVAGLLPVSPRCLPKLTGPDDPLQLRGEGPVFCG